MKRLLWLLLMLPLPAQTPFNVQVVDSNGHSLADVTLQPVTGESVWVRVGANGRYEGATTSGSIVIRHLQYESVVVRRQRISALSSKPRRRLPMLRLLRIPLSF